MALDTNLVAHYLLNNNADDSYGTYDGTSVGGVDFQGDVTDFTNVDAHRITLPTITGIKTLSMWYSFHSHSDYNTVLSTPIPSYDKTHLIAWGAGVAFRFYITNLAWFDLVADVGTIPLDTQFNLTVTTDGTTYSFYTDGVLLGTTASTEPIAIDGFGFHEAETRGHNGTISNVRIYSDVKDQTFITDLFEEGYYPKPLMLPTTVGLIAHYPLTGTAEDTTGTYDGTENNLTYVDDAEFGAVCDFNGSTSFVGTTSGADVLSGDITMCAWVKLDSDATATEQIMAQRNNDAIGSSVRGIAFGSSNNVFAYSRNSTGSYYGVSHTLGTNEQTEWRYISLIDRGTTTELYVDGVYINNVERASNDTFASVISIGCISRTDGEVSFLNGNIKDSKVYDIALTQQEITDIYNYEKNFRPIDIDDGLVAYYPLANNSLDNYYNEYDGTDTAMTYDGESGVFTGGAEYTSNNASIATNSDFTVSLWMQLNSVSGYDTIAYSDNVWDGFNFHTGNGDTSINVGSSSTVSERFSPTELPVGSIVLNKKQHFVYTISDTTIYFYIDGIKVAEKTGVKTTSWGGFNIGHSSTTINGNISKVRIYNKTLTSEQVEVIYNTENLVEASPLATASLAVTATALATAITSNIPIATASLVVTATAKAIPYIPVATASLVVTASASHTEIASANASVSLTASAVVTFYPRGLATLSVTATASPLQHVPNATATLTVTASAHNVVYEAIVTANVSVTSQANVIASIPTTTTFTFVQSIQLTEVQSSFKFVQSIEQPTTNTIIQRVNI